VSIISEARDLDISLCEGLVIDEKDTVTGNARFLQYVPTQQEQEDEKIGNP
jgi:hypothetical protein